MDQRKNGGGGTDAERERENGRDGEAGRFNELAQRVADIFKHEGPTSTIVIRNSQTAVPNLYEDWVREPAGPDGGTCGRCQTVEHDWTHNSVTNMYTMSKRGFAKVCAA